MNNSHKIILDLCGGTGSWSKPYKDAGYDVRVITLPDYDVRTYTPPENVYGILAAPPCTEFSLAKNGSPYPRKLHEGLTIVEACERVIRACQLQGNLKFWAMENPVGLLRKFLGRPKFTFKQWQFGDLGVKPTDVWGFFDVPTATVTEQPDGITKRYKSGKVNTLAWAAPKWPEYDDYIKRLPKKEQRAALRAITPPGFAKAFYEANR